MQNNGAAARDVNDMIIFILMGLARASREPVQYGSEHQLATFGLWPPTHRGNELPNVLTQAYELQKSVERELPVRNDLAPSAYATVLDKLVRAIRSQLHDDQVHQ